MIFLELFTCRMMLVGGKSASIGLPARQINDGTFISVILAVPNSLVKSGPSVPSDKANGEINVKVSDTQTLPCRIDENRAGDNDFDLSFVDRGGGKQPFPHTCPTSG